MATLFPDSSLKKAEEEIAHYEDKENSVSSSQKKGQYDPYERLDKSSHESKSGQQAWKTIGSYGNGKKGKVKSSN